LELTMIKADFPDRYYASVPADDPQFGELREVLAAVKQTGRHSPAARMLGEWALLGFLLTTGRISISGSNGASTTLPGELPDPRELLAAKRRLEAAAAGLGDFDAWKETIMPLTLRRRPRLPATEPLVATPPPTPVIEERPALSDPEPARTAPTARGNAQVMHQRDHAGAPMTPGATGCWARCSSSCSAWTSG
jgi:hypothetical protein